MKQFSCLLIYNTLLIMFVPCYHNVSSSIIISLLRTNCEKILCKAGSPLNLKIKSHRFGQIINYRENIVSENSMKNIINLKISSTTKMRMIKSKCLDMMCFRMRRVIEPYKSEPKKVVQTLNHVRLNNQCER